MPAFIVIPSSPRPCRMANSWKAFRHPEDFRVYRNKCSLRQIWSNLYSANGFLPVIFITDPGIAHEAFVEKAAVFASRSKVPKFSPLNNNGRSINSLPYGTRWIALCRNLIGPVRSMQRRICKQRGRFCLEELQIIQRQFSTAFCGSFSLSAMAGDSAARALLQKLTQAASIPYFGILERWLYEGVIDDPYGGFFIDKNKVLQKKSLSRDYNAMSWQQRYSRRLDVPGFLSTFQSSIFSQLHYLNAIRECGHTVRLPFLEDKKLTNTGPKHHYLDRLKSIRDWLWNSTPE